jgi:hypothetical protein
MNDCLLEDFAGDVMKALAVAIVSECTPRGDFIGVAQCLRKVCNAIRGAAEAIGSYFSSGKKEVAQVWRALPIDSRGKRPWR